MAVGLIAMSITASACNIPVFRYALERWAPDDCQVLVIHDSPISEDQRQWIDRLTGPIGDDQSKCNVDVQTVDITQSQPDDLVAVGRKAATDNAALPLVVVRTKLSRGRWTQQIAGSLNEQLCDQLVTSPIRTELRRRLMAGDSVVWLMIPGTNETLNRESRERLERSLESLPGQLELPDGVGLPGSELYADLPLLLRFSVLEMGDDGVADPYLKKLLIGFQQEAFDEGQPLFIPVFGRGRALEVLPGEMVQEHLIENISRFLCSACSCLVKERNPGFDLMIAAQWENDLFGGIENSPPDRSREEGKNRPPVLLEIPSGR
ncbi:hypothetical protein [Crateriforma spongiae]|uniref:hypothetical protein n=1 Tax=Crateriforma spongiae TaxID=2724528 RepID=UPI0014465221|nr:hypothetical protein [Crateriforma spongiae]